MDAERRNDYVPVFRTVLRFEGEHSVPFPVSAVSGDPKIGVRVVRAV